MNIEELIHNIRPKKYCVEYKDDTVKVYIKTRIITLEMDEYRPIQEVENYLSDMLNRKNNVEQVKAEDYGEQRKLNIQVFNPSV